MPTQAKSGHTITIPEDLSQKSTKGFSENLEQLLNERPARIDFDCSELHLATSSHVNVLWKARERCSEAGISVRLCALSPGLIRILKVLDIYGLFETDRLDQQSQSALCRAQLPVDGESRLKTSIQPTAEAIYDLLGEFREFLGSLQIDDVCRLELETVAYETLTNIRLHGHLGQTDTVTFEAAAFEDRIELIFTDAGKPFNPSGQAPSFDPGEAISNRQSGGIGLVMIARMTDAMEYDRKDDCQNVLTLKKYWDQTDD